MKLLVSPLLIALLVALSTPMHPAAAASHRPVPVVATWFSNLHPKVGQRETVSVQFFAGKRYLAGARLSVSIQIGKKALLQLRGTTTNKQGEAWARFTVPRQARGKMMWAMTSLTYQKQIYRGNNRVQVAR